MRCVHVKFELGWRPHLPAPFLHDSCQVATVLSKADFKFLFIMALQPLSGPPDCNIHRTAKS